ncbi:hypothetical protein ACIP01_25150 [Pseudomonas monteilii]|uniref:hypothetical protein n=1 Tax=Pseudomonas monteilii TaxID=76759 RepID=UPI00382D1C8D
MSKVRLSFHTKRLSDFDLKRIVKAEAQGFDKPITGYLCGAFIKAHTGIGVVFDHARRTPYGRFADGHIICTSNVVRAEREGRFWVLTTQHSRYVLATFRKGGGRNSLREFLRLSRGHHHHAPGMLQ